MKARRLLNFSWLSSLDVAPRIAIIVPAAGWAAGQPFNSNLLQISAFELVDLTLGFKPAFMTGARTASRVERGLPRSKRSALSPKA